MKNNVIPFPSIGTDDFILDFGPMTSGEMEKVFDLMNFLSNNKELVNKFKPDVEKFLEREHLFKETAFRRDFELAFEDFVSSLIRNEVIDHFNFSPEDVAILTTKDFLDMITEGYYFNPKNYRGVEND